MKFLSCIILGIKLESLSQSNILMFQELLMDAKMVTRYLVSCIDMSIWVEWQQLTSQKAFLISMMLRYAASFKASCVLDLIGKCYLIDLSDQWIYNFETMSNFLQVDKYLHSKEEMHYKKIIWEQMNSKHETVMLPFLCSFLSDITLFECR